MVVTISIESIVYLGWGIWASHRLENNNNNNNKTISIPRNSLNFLPRSTVGWEGRGNLVPGLSLVTLGEGGVSKIQYF